MQRALSVHQGIPKGRIRTDLEIFPYQRQTRPILLDLIFLEVSSKYAKPDSIQSKFVRET